MKANPGEGAVLFATSDPGVMSAGVRGGFVAEYDAAQDPGLAEIVSPSAEWSFPIRDVTHVDRHRTDKVQQVPEDI